eukprot:TRINITY_DN25773_c0_g1_i1.p1 TRINITY_DN25773_c0_g1~~TRINITY_DN25773_c0_g1_i1.p1  ORF type:complete len:250 (+),score=5.36 TRINITY_DN25773_c0_g1_i1:64-813(+)
MCIRDSDVPPLKSKTITPQTEDTVFTGITSSGLISVGFSISFLAYVIQLALIYQFAQLHFPDQGWIRISVRIFAIVIMVTCSCFNILFWRGLDDESNQPIHFLLVLVTKASLTYLLLDTLHIFGARLVFACLAVMAVASGLIAFAAMGLKLGSKAFGFHIWVVHGLLFALFVFFVFIEAHGELYVKIPVIIFTGLAFFGNVMIIGRIALKSEKRGNMILVALNVLLNWTILPHQVVYCVYKATCGRDKK